MLSLTLFESERTTLTILMLFWCWTNALLTCVQSIEVWEVVCSRTVWYNERSKVIQNKRKLYLIFICLNQWLSRVVPVKLDLSEMTLSCSNKFLDGFSGRFLYLLNNCSFRWRRSFQHFSQGYNLFNHQLPANIVFLIWFATVYNIFLLLVKFKRHMWLKHLGHQFSFCSLSSPLH